MKAGNYQKMREALEELIANIEMRSSTFGLNVMVDTKTFLDAKAALAIPPRNCAVFKTESERRGAFIAYYNEVFDLKGSKYEIDTCDLKHDVDGILHDYIKWLFDPAESEAKDEADGGVE